MFTKNISTLVKNILGKEEKIQNRISVLTNEIQIMKDSIQDQTKQLMEFELADDNAGQDKCKKEIKVLREKLVNHEDLFGIYKKELETASLPQSELRKIKEAARREIEVRKEKLESNLREQTKIESQIKELTTKLEKMKNAYSDIHGDRLEVEEIQKILRYIDPRASKVPHSSRKSFISYWINDMDTELYFPNTDPPFDGIHRTYTDLGNPFKQNPDLRALGEPPEEKPKKMTRTYIDLGNPYKKNPNLDEQGTMQVQTTKREIVQD